MKNPSNRILMNTFFLYGKMCITIFLSFLSTRIVLQALGVVDYGIFGVIGGVINMLGFLSASMAATTQRFMSYSEGNGNFEDKKQVFNVSIVLHALIALCAVVLLCGFFPLFFETIINIPSGSVYAAKVVYFSMVFSVAVTVLTVPYDAVVNSHEDMLYYAIVGVVEGIGKLLVALYITIVVPDNRLIVYGILTAGLSIMIMIAMRIYCHKRYAECQFDLLGCFSKSKMKEMVYFASYKLYTQTSSMIGNFGMGLLANHYFGAFINAAISISSQTVAYLQSFSNNMMKAVNPVIVKSEGEKSRGNMLVVSMYSCKYSFLMLAVFAAPVLVYLDKILALWLVNVPEWAYLMSLFAIVRALNECIFLPLEISIGAVGNIKGNSLWSSIINLLPLLILFVLFHYGFSPMAYIVVPLIFWGVAYELKTLWFAKEVCGLRVGSFLNRFVKWPYGVFCASILFGIVIRLLIGDSIGALFLALPLVVLFFLTLVWLFAMGATEKEYAKLAFDKILNKIKKR